jgi:hypothetical protein
MFLKKLDITSDSNRINNDLITILETQTAWSENDNIWHMRNQVGLTSRPDSIDPWQDCIGSKYDYKNDVYLFNENDFTRWNIDQSWYVRQQLELLRDTLGIELGRIRFMRLLPRTGLSVHRDYELRYHLVLKTNPAVVFAHHVTTDSDIELPSVAQCYHIPQDNHWYELDAREPHWVYNGGEQERIHLVVCGC